MPYKEKEKNRIIILTIMFLVCIAVLYTALYLKHPLKEAMYEIFVREKRIPPVKTDFVIKDMSGNIYTEDAKGRKRVIENGNDLLLNENITVEDQAKMVVKSEGASVYFSGNTKLKINSFKDKVDITLFKGLGNFKVNPTKKKEFKIQTPAAVVGVRGTVFEVNVTEDLKTEVTCLQGIVETYNKKEPEKRVLLRKNTSCTVEKGRIPDKLTEPKKDVLERLKIFDKNIDSKSPLTELFTQKIFKEIDDKVKNSNKVIREVNKRRKEEELKVLYKAKEENAKLESEMKKLKSDYKEFYDDKYIPKKENKEGEIEISTELLEELKNEYKKEFGEKEGLIKFDRDYKLYKEGVPNKKFLDAARKLRFYKELQKKYEKRNKKIYEKDEKYLKYKSLIEKEKK